MLRQLLAAPTVAERHDLSRQIDNGLCDGCQRERQAAAVEYEQAADEMRMVTYCGAGWNGRGAAHHALTQALKRGEAANARCVELKMWPDERSTTRPIRYYREES